MKKETEAEAVTATEAITKFIVVWVFSPLLFVYFLGALAWVFLVKSKN